MRKAAHESLNKVVAHGLNDYQIEEALVLARNGLHNASSWDSYVRGATTSMMLRALYNQSPVRRSDASVDCVHDQSYRYLANAMLA